MDTNALNAKVDAALDRIAARDLQSPQPKLCTFIHPLRQEVVWGPDPKPDTRPMVVAVGAAEGNEAARLPVRCHNARRGGSRGSDG